MDFLEIEGMHCLEKVRHQRIKDIASSRQRAIRELHWSEAVHAKLQLDLEEYEYFMKHYPHPGRNARWFDRCHEIRTLQVLLKDRIAQLKKCIAVFESGLSDIRPLAS